MPDIKHSIPITAKAEAIFPLVSTGAGFRQWWAEDVSEVGGAVELGFFKRATVYRVRLKTNSAPSTPNGCANLVMNGTARASVFSSTRQKKERCCASLTLAGDRKPIISLHVIPLGAS